MIDFHSHFLPQIDDGSSSLDESMDMLRIMHAQNVTKIVATPHFYANQDSIEHFLKRRDKAYDRVRCQIEKEALTVPDIMTGAEVYYFGGIGKAEQVHSLCMQGTDILLLEMPFTQWTESMLRSVEQLLNKQKLRVVLAHVERYRDYQKDASIWNEIFSMPVVPQMNAGAFLNWKKRRKNLKLLEGFGDVLLGSDCHNLEHRRPNLPEGREVIAGRLGSEQLDRIDALGERMLSS